MPSVSEKQRRFMAAAAHDPEFARRAGIDQDVAKEFNESDQRESTVRRIARKLFGKPDTSRTTNSGIRG